jgi:hypothetical protein
VSLARGAGRIVSVVRMSCIRFNTPAQRRQLKALAPAMLTAEQAAALHPSPVMTESKIRRLRLLAEDANPKIRERAALDAHTPADVLEALSRDSNEEVRACVARNEAAPCDVLRSLARDRSERVRSFLALNFFVPADAMALLADDRSATVRDLVQWKAQLATA